MFVILQLKPKIIHCSSLYCLKCNEEKVFPDTKIVINRASSKFINAKKCVTWSMKLLLDFLRFTFFLNFLLKNVFYFFFHLNTTHNLIINNYNHCNIYLSFNSKVVKLIIKKRNETKSNHTTKIVQFHQNKKWKKKEKKKNKTNKTVKV